MYRFMIAKHFLNMKNDVSVEMKCWRSCLRPLSGETLIFDQKSRKSSIQHGGVGAASRSLSQPLAASLAASDDKLGSLKENQSSILAVCRLPGIDDSKTRGFQGRMILRLDGVRLVDW